MTTGVGAELVAFPFHDWRKADTEGFRTRDLHILEELSRDPRVTSVLVVDRPVSAAELLIKGGRPTAAGRVMALTSAGRWTATLSQVRPKIYTLDTRTPDLIYPIVQRRGWWFSVFRSTEILRATQWAMRLLFKSTPKVIAWTPTVAPLVSRLGCDVVVFDSLDNWLIHPELRKNAREAQMCYRDLLPRSAAVFASSPASCRVLQQFGVQVQLLPNGVNPEQFQVQAPRPQDLPPPPVVGYAGKLAERIDAALVRDTAAQLPKVSFAFLGPVLNRRAIAALRGIQNVHLLGDRPYGDLPAYLQHFDVAWIPHRVGEGETGGDPIKLYEYWAAGREVVSTRIDNIERYADFLHIVGNADEASTIIHGLLAGKHPRRRASVPPDRTWRVITRTILGAILEPAV